MDFVDFTEIELEGPVTYTVRKGLGICSLVFRGKRKFFEGERLKSKSVIRSFQSGNRSRRSFCKERRSDSLSWLLLKEQQEQMSSFTKSYDEQFALLFWA